MPYDGTPRGPDWAAVQRDARTPVARRRSGEPRHSLVSWRGQSGDFGPEDDREQKTAADPSGSSRRIARVAEANQLQPTRQLGVRQSADRRSAALLAEHAPEEACAPSSTATRH